MAYSLRNGVCGSERTGIQPYCEAVNEWTPTHTRNKTLSGQIKSEPVSKPTSSQNPSLEQTASATLSKVIIDALDDAKAEDMVRLALDGKSAIADEMIIVSGRSNRHVSSISDKLLEDLKANGFKDLRVEGQQHCDWVLVDTGDVIVHIFRPEVRLFYNLEKLWSPDAPDDQPGV